MVGERRGRVGRREEGVKRGQEVSPHQEYPTVLQPDRDRKVPQTDHTEH